MRKHRFYSKRQNLRIGSSVLLEGFDANHARKSLRLKKGDTIYIFNGGKEYEAKLKLVTREAIMAEIIQETTSSTDPEKSVTIFQALTKAPSFELVLEKLTEIGIDSFVPFESEYSVVKVDKVSSKKERWEKIILSAAKQSERIRVPNIEVPIAFEDIQKYIEEFEVVVLFTPKKDIKEDFIDLSELKKYKNMAFIIGPEGGFSPRELELSKEWNIEYGALGNTILRSETASISAASILLLS